MLEAQFGVHTVMAIIGFAGNPNPALAAREADWLAEQQYAQAHIALLSLP
jgi:hypothetical protein